VTNSRTGQTTGTKVTKPQAQAPVQQTRPVQNSAGQSGRAGQSNTAGRAGGTANRQPPPGNQQQNIQL
jgi:hypothetical protein